MHNIGFWILSIFTLLSCSDDRTTGTTSGTENTIVALTDKDGKVAIGSKIAIRSINASPFQQGYVDSAMTDDAGQAMLNIPKNDTLFLEITDTKGRKSWRKKLTLEDFKSDGIRVDGMQTPTTYKSKINAPETLTEEVWIGIEGTDNFTQVDSNGDFSLEDIIATDVPLAVMYLSKGRVKQTELSSWHNAMGQTESFSEIDIDFSVSENKASNCVSKIESWTLTEKQVNWDFSLLQGSGTLSKLAFNVCDGTYFLQSQFYASSNDAEMYHTGLESQVYLSSEQAIVTLDELANPQEQISKSVPVSFTKVHSMRTHRDTLYVLGEKNDEYFISTSSVLYGQYMHVRTIAVQAVDNFELQGNRIIQYNMDGSFHLLNSLDGRVLSSSSFQNIEGKILSVHLTANGQVWVVDSSKKLKIFESENGVALLELPLPNQDVSYFGLTP